MKVLIGCTQDKASVPCEARDMYKGRGFVLLRKYFEQNNIEYAILSAKYGIIKPTQVIEPYDQKMTKPYEGKVDPSFTHFCGGKIYFKKLEGKLIQLLPYDKPGRQLCYIHWLMAGRTLEDIFKSAEKIKSKGIIRSVYEMLHEKELTLDEIVAELCDEYGPSESYLKTVKGQLRQSRLGFEKECTVHFDEQTGKYKITSEYDYYTKEPR